MRLGTIKGKAKDLKVCDCAQLRKEFSKFTNLLHINEHKIIVTAKKFTNQKRRNEIYIKVQRSHIYAIWHVLAPSKGFNLLIGKLFKSPSKL